MDVKASLTLIAENCTSCMLCIRACPVWCLDLQAHTELTPGSGRGKTVLLLDDFTIDYRLCMMCGLCVDVCPFEALEWSSEPPPLTWHLAARDPDPQVPATDS